MDRDSKAVKAGVVIYRFTAVISLVLTFALFISSPGSSFTRLIVFMVWLALCAFTCIRIIGDMISGQHRKAQNFQNTIAAWDQNTGDHQTALKYFWAMTILSSLLKLAVPVVLWFIFR